MKPRRDPRGSSHEPATTWRASQVPSEAWGPGTPSPLAGQWPEGPELAGGGGAAAQRYFLGSRTISWWKHPVGDASPLQKTFTCLWSEGKDKHSLSEF